MRIFILLMTAGLMVMVAAETARAEQPPRGARGCRLSDLETPREVHRYLLLPGPKGQLVVLQTARYECQGRDPATGRRAPWSTYYARYGLDTAEGQVLIPRQYDAVLPYSETAAFVLREDKRWARYRYGRGEEAVPAGHVEFRWISPLLAGEAGCLPPRGKPPTTPSAAMSMTAPDAKGRSEVAVYLGDGPPLLFTGLGGPGVDHPVESHGNVLITHWVDDSGSRRSRLYNKAGEVLTPELGRVERWATNAPTGTDGAVCSFFRDLGLYVAGPTLDADPADPVFGALLLPVDDGGRPLALPAGAIGVLAVPRRFHGANRLPPTGWGRTSVWAVVYPTDDGFSFTLTPGSLQHALAAAPNEPRYRNLARRVFPATFDTIETGRLMSVGLNENVWRGRIYDRWDIVGPPAADAATADAGVGSTEHALDFDARNARLRAERAVSQQRYAAALAAGEACTLPSAIGAAEDATIFAHAQACPRNYSLNERAWLQWRGAPAAVIAAVDQAYAASEQEAAAQRAAWAEQARSYVSASEREAMWRAAGDAWIRGIEDGADDWQDQRRRQFEADWQRSQRAY